MPNKLELTWYGKDKPIAVEPRLLIEDAARSNCAADPDTENMLIHGDNLLALKALENKYAGQVKCIYIDPPYNTGSAFEHYDDNLEHSIWLNLMRPRLEILWNLLAADGSIWISIDDNEEAYLKVLCDELFGRYRFVSNIAWQRTYSTRNDAKGIVNEVEHILVYAKNEGWQPNRLPRTAEMDKKYKNPDGDVGLWRPDNAYAPGASTHQGMVYAIQHPFTGEMLYPSNGRCWTFGQDQMLEIMCGWCDYKLEEIDDAERRAEVCGVPVTEIRTGVKAIVLTNSLKESQKIAKEVLKKGPWPRFFFSKNGKGGIARKTYLSAVGNVPPTIFVYNIDKFNKEDATMRKVNEVIGDSFYKYLSSLSDLVLIMDESHHYRAERGAAALNELHPLLGLELTATPLVTKGNKQTKFKNVVYEYPLSKAIEDGYTRTPFAITRTDINFYNFGDEQLDKLMLQDGIAAHERTKRRLEAYALNHGKSVVKPFMLIVCKDTDHAAWVKNYVCSEAFQGGAYKSKTIVVHSKQKGSESVENTRLLLEVERPDNPIEIVIHVNMLKEGWDVNNLYTIVPLRTAASKILREQMVGRGLRLPYGERTGDRDVDAVMLTAHDKFNELIEEAKSGDSIFKAGNVIKAEENEPEQSAPAQLTIDLDPHTEREKAYTHTGLKQSDERDKLIDRVNELIEQEVPRKIQRTPTHTLTEQDKQEIAEKVSAQLAGDEDLGVIFEENRMPLNGWLLHQTEQVYVAAKEKFIPIPRIRVTDNGPEEYVFVDFEPDLEPFNHVPVGNDVIIQSLTDMEDRDRVKGDAIDFEGYNPKKVILAELRKKPEIDYEKCSALLFKLITAVCDQYEARHGKNGLQNIVMMYKRDIAGKLYTQMMQHFYCENGLIQEEVVGVSDYNMEPQYTWTEKVGLYEGFTGKIQSVLFTGIKKGVFSTAKFDSDEGELTLARILETDPDVLNWLRPHPLQFNITYNRSRHYEPDFVVETESVIYLVEVKGEDKLKDPDVLAKKARGVQYCAVASRWGKANGYKEWRYLFIPAGQITASSSFKVLAERFGEK